MKIRNSVAVILLLGLIMSMLPGTFAGAASGSEEESRPYVKMTVEESIPGMVKYGREMVFYVELRSDRAVKGRLVMQTFSDEQKISSYQQDIELVMGQQTVKRSLYLDSGLTSVLFQIQDEEGKVLSETEYIIQETADMIVDGKVLAGVISDAPDGLESFQDLTVGGVYDTVMKTVPIEAGRIPAQASELDMLDVLLLEQYDTSGFTEDQKTAVLDWVQKGGRLIVGTGSRGDDTTAFLEELLVGQGRSERLWTGFGCLSEADFIYSENKKEADLYLTKLKEAIDLNREDGNSMIQLQNYGEGRIILCAFSLVDFCSFLEEYQNQYQLGLPSLGEWVSSLLDANYIDQEVTLGLFNTNRYENSYPTVSGTATDKISRIGKYVVVLILYVVLIGPGLFLLLKHFRKQSMLQGCIILSAFVFSLVIFFFGRNTRYDKPFVIYSRIVENDGGKEAETTTLNIRSPFIQSYHFNIEGSSKVEILHENYFLGEERAMQNDQVEIYQKEEGTEITLQDISAFTPRLFTLKDQEDREESLSYEVQYFDGELTGYVMNRSDMELQGAALLFGSHYVCLGTFAPGETKVLDGKAVYDTVWDSNAASKNIVEQVLTGRQPGAEQKNRKALLDYYIGSWKDEGEEQAVVIGFRRNDMGEALSGTEYDLSGITLYAQKIKINRERDGILYRERLYHTAWTEEGHTTDDNRISYSETTIVSYYAGSGFSVHNMKMESRASLVADDYLEAFDGQIYLYNYKTARYDPVKEDKKWSREELRPYLMDGNAVRVKYVQNNYSGWEYGIVLPYLSMTGRR